MINFIRFTMFVIALAGSWVNFVAADGTSYQGPEFVDPESLSDAFRNTTHSIVGGLNSGDVSDLEKYFDFERVGVRAGKDFFNTDREYRDFIKGVKDSKRNVLTTLVKQIEATGGEVILAGYVKRKQGVMPQIRIDLGDYGLDYVEYLFNKEKDGSYQVIDWYQLSSGRMFSESIGIISRLLIDPNPGILKKLLGIAEFDRDNIKIIKAIGEARKRADYVEANRLYTSLSPQIRNSRIFLEIGIGFANLLDDDALYKNRLKLLAENHGSDASASFLLIDYFYLLGNAEGVLASIEVMERNIGRDGMTTYLKANAYYEIAKDYGKAKILYQEAIDIEPNLEEPYQSLASIYIEERNYANAVEVFKLLESNFGIRYTANDFYDTPEIDLFKKSAEFKQWMKSR